MGHVAALLGTVALLAVIAIILRINHRLKQEMHNREALEQRGPLGLDSVRWQ